MALASIGLGAVTGSVGVEILGELPDDAWEDLEPVEETELAPAKALAGGLASAPPAVRSESVKAAPSPSVRSSLFRTRPDAENR